MNATAFLFLLLLAPQQPTTWTAEQLAAANTAKDINYISDIERDAVKYINLARLYPKQFARLEVENYFGTERYGPYVKNSMYRKSLIQELQKMAPLKAYVFDKELYDDARCFAAEQSKNGETGHARKKCPKNAYAECCSYGMNTGRDIAMQWLIDDKVASLGHRKNCLNARFTRIGLSYNSHKVWNHCAVAEFIY